MTVIAGIIDTLLSQRRPFAYNSHMLVGAVRGIYAFWLDRRACLYVGKSEDIGHRLYQHRVQGHNERLQRYFHAWPKEIEMSYVALNDHTAEEIGSLEQQAITLLRPIANVTYNRRARR